MTDIILILYGDRKDLDTCIKSIETHCHDYTLHIIDNNQVNRGFTKACNEGIAAGTGEWIWLLNQDAVVLPGAQEGLINRFNYHPKVGIVGSMQRDPTDPDIIRHGGTLRAFPGGIHDGGRVSMGHCSIPKKQTWINYASVMLKREMVQEIGPMDDSLFLLFSDSDYCYYARSKGWEVWYSPESQVLHRLNASKTITEWHKKDMEAFMKKWGIVQTDKGFIYSEKFSKLDMFP
jgi:GT2 family glycosyltransferase